MALTCRTQPEMLVAVPLDDETLIEASEPSRDRRSARVYLGDVGFGAVTLWITPPAEAGGTTLPNGSSRRAHVRTVMVFPGALLGP